MRSTRVRRILTALVLGAACSLACAADARAGSPPPSNLVVDANWQGRIDLEWRQLPAVLKAIATDIDRDGDLDVVASTVDQPIVVWINDGTGRLTRQRPSRPAPVMGGTGDAVPPETGSRAPQVAQAPAPSFVAPQLEARAPPPARSSTLVDDLNCGLLTDRPSSTDPRGPPSGTL
jgi:FG-GAP-like repeat